MNSATPSKSLVVLTADRNAQFAIRGILSRYKSLGIRQLGQDAVDYITHPEKDPGVLRSSRDLLALYRNSHTHALAIMDREGCGRESLTAEALENQIEDSLRLGGWEGRAAAVVIDPELDVWVWADSPHVEKEIRWAGQAANLRAWLDEKGFAFNAAGKPLRPKEALAAACLNVHQARSSALYKSLAEKVSLARCTDRAFMRLKATLQAWFPET